MERLCSITVYKQAKYYLLTLPMPSILWKTSVPAGENLCLVCLGRRPARSQEGRPLGLGRCSGCHGKAVHNYKQANTTAEAYKIFEAEAYI